MNRTRLVLLASILILTCFFLPQVLFSLLYVKDIIERTPAWEWVRLMFLIISGTVGLELWFRLRSNGTMRSTIFRHKRVRDSIVVTVALFSGATIGASHVFVTSYLQQAFIILGGAIVALGILYLLGSDELKKELQITRGRERRE
jgi:hypothetical protein